MSDADVLEGLLARRHSCRGFLPREVPREIITRICAIAQRTASWCNSQPWQIIVTSGEATNRFRDALCQHVTEFGSGHHSDFDWPREYRGAALARRRACGFALYDSVGVARGDCTAAARQAFENFRLFGAPHVAIVTTDEALGTYGAVDCGAFVANFLLGAESLGVAAIAQAALASQSAFVRNHFGLRDDRKMVCGISFGYEATEHPANGFRTRRAALDEVISWADD